MRIFLIAFFTFLSLPAFAKDYPSVIGRASVVDGHSLNMNGYRIRIWGINTPPADKMCRDKNNVIYNCGQVFISSLSEWIDKTSPIKCKPLYKGRDYDFIAICYNLKNEDVAKWLIRNGYATFQTNTSDKLYGKLQQKAKENKRGMWQGAFVTPWVIRQIGHE